MDGVFSIPGRADVIAQLEYVWTIMNNATKHVKRQSTEIHGLAVHQVGIALGSLTNHLVIASQKCINQIISRSIARPWNAVRRISLVPPLVCKIVKIRMPHSLGKSISLALKGNGPLHQVKQLLILALKEAKACFISQT